ncbi:MAG TPA: cytochrome c biogenesis protein CcdA [Thermomicrobiales bacterium]|jgi:cytochrome c-type biogenesis protein|nr:cytochrome c biogenesis protein CcdA [Thermomicrobiales bacterium]
MPDDVTWLAALVAGLFSFTSPCVLPLVPVFLARIAGVSATPDVAVARGPIIANALAYIGGFSVVFVLLGVALGAGGSLVATADVVVEYRQWLVRIGGALLILIGLRQIGLIRIPFLDRTRQIETGTVSGQQAAGVGSSFMIGLAFGAGWSPCVGPILGIILTMAASSGDVGRAAWLLVVYSLGLGVPFLLIAATFGSSQSVIRAINRRMGLVVAVSGAIMLGVGAIMLLGIYERLFVEIVRAAPWLPWEPTV